MNLFDRIEAVRERWNVLEHPFYVRWSAGELTREELSFYAAEYRHAVEALAEAAEAAADAAAGTISGLAEHAAEERAHVELWDRFAEALGADLEREPLAETRACARAWTAAAGALDGLAVLYAVESGQPAISRTKLEGLAEHYGIGTDAPAAEYFALHAELDHDHAAHSRRAIEAHVQTADGERMLTLAEGALAGNWGLLDGVERRFGR